MNWGRLYFGTLVLAAGVILLLGNTGLLDAGSVYATWWPLAVILAGLLSLAANPGHWAIASIILLAGVVFQLSRLDIVDLGSIVLPAALVLIGLFVLFGRGMTDREEASDQVNNFNVFSGSELSSRSQSFTGGSISAVFGGSELDLRQARLAPGATLDVFAAFGGVELSVPSDWHVVVRGLPIFGGIENSTSRATLPEDAPTLTINATVLFGSLEVKPAPTP